MNKDTIVSRDTTKFINETTLFLDRVELTVHALMLDIGNQELQRELYQQIRAVAKYSKELKQDKFSAIAHYIQGVLKRLIDGKYTNNQVTTGVLFEGVNILKSLVDELAGGKAFLSIEEIVQKLTPTEDGSFLSHATVGKERELPADVVDVEQKRLLIANPIPHDDLFIKPIEPAINIGEPPTTYNYATTGALVSDEPINIGELVEEYEEALKLTQNSKQSSEQGDDVDYHVSSNPIITDSIITDSIITDSINTSKAKSDPIISNRAESYNIDYQGDIDINSEFEQLFPGNSLLTDSDTISSDELLSSINAQYEGRQPIAPIDTMNTMKTTYTKHVTDIADVTNITEFAEMKADATPDEKFSKGDAPEVSAVISQIIEPSDSAQILSDNDYNKDYFNHIAQKYQKAFSYELPPIERGIDGIKRLLRHKINNENEADSQLSSLVGDLSLNQNKLLLISSLVSQELDEGSELSRVLTKTVSQLRGIADQLLDVVVHSNLTPFKVAFSRVPRIVRDYMKVYKKEIDFIIDADGVMIDRRVVTKIYEPLLYVIRNSLRYFTEDTQDKIRPRIILSAQTYGDDIVIKLRDNGYGISIEKMKAKAIATNIISIDEATKLSDNTAYGLVFLLGLTLGEDPKEDKQGELLNRNIIAVNGIVNFLSSTDTRLRKVSTEDRYTEFQLLVPMLGVTTHVLFVEVNDYIMAVPLTNIIDILKVNSLDDLGRVKKSGSLRIGSGEDYATIPTINLSEVLGLDTSGSNTPRAVAKSASSGVTKVEQVIQNSSSAEEDAQVQGDGVGTYIIVASAGRRAALLVNKVIAEDRVVIKSMSTALGANKGFSGAAIVEGDKVRLVLNINDIFDLVQTFPRHTYFRVQDKLSFKSGLKL